MLRNLISMAVLPSICIVGTLSLCAATVDYGSVQLNRFRMLHSHESEAEFAVTVIAAREMIVSICPDVNRLSGQYKFTAIEKFKYVDFVLRNNIASRIDICECVKKLKDKLLPESGAVAMLRIGMPEVFNKKVFGAEFCFIPDGNVLLGENQGTAEFDIKSVVAGRSTIRKKCAMSVDAQCDCPVVPLSSCDMDEGAFIIDGDDFSVALSSMLNSVEVCIYQKEKDVFRVEIRIARHDLHRFPKNAILYVYTTATGFVKCILNRNCSDRTSDGTAVGRLL